MTREELEEVLRALEIDVDAPADHVYVFYAHADGRVDNFSLGVTPGGRMSDAAVERLMRREYPSTRDGRVLAVERPDWRSAEQRWLDTTEVCNMLHVSDRTLRSWRREGYLKGRFIGGRVYYRYVEIVALLESNALQENGRLDRTEAKKQCLTDFGVRKGGAEMNGKERK